MNEIKRVSTSGAFLVHAAEWTVCLAAALMLGDCVWERVFQDGQRSYWRETYPCGFQPVCCKGPMERQR